MARLHRPCRPRIRSARSRSSATGLRRCRAGRAFTLAHTANTARVVVTVGAATQVVRCAQRTVVALPQRQRLDRGSDGAAAHGPCKARLTSYAGYVDSTVIVSCPALAVYDAGRRFGCCRRNRPSGRRYTLPHHRRGNGGTMGKA
eukprot:scaffold2193_cov74-Phaeocystis_antarctica.AAC.4